LATTTAASRSRTAYCPSEVRPVRSSAGARIAATTAAVVAASAGTPPNSTVNPSAASASATAANRSTGHRRLEQVAPGCSTT